MSCPEGCTNGGGQLKTDSKERVNQRFFLFNFIPFICAPVIIASSISTIIPIAIISLVIIPFPVLSLHCDLNHLLLICMSRYIEYVAGVASNPMPQEVLDGLERRASGEAMVSLVVRFIPTHDNKHQEDEEAPGESKGYKDSTWNFRTGFKKREDSIVAVLEAW